MSSGAPIRVLTPTLFSLLLFSFANAQPSIPPPSSVSVAPQTTVPVTVESLAKTIAEDKGRAVYDAFNAISKSADTPEKQAKAFSLVFPYLTSDKDCVVDGYYPALSHVTRGSFSYAELAAGAIRNLGDPARRGLVDGLASTNSTLAEHCAIVLCQIQETALHAKEGPWNTNYPLLEPGARNSLEAFLEERGDTFPVKKLTLFYRAGLLTAAGHIHRILKTTQDPREKHSAIIYLGGYGYAPALDDLLQIFKETTDANLRIDIREDFQWFADSEKVTKALNEIKQGTTDEGLRKECETALELVRLKAEWRKQYAKERTNEAPQEPAHKGL
jgi:hypothetical protein